MDLGQRLKQARLDAGFSQRQLCGEVITRNMLSQIENGSARPSMDTLRYLAERLGKPISFFLEETTASPNQALILQARRSYLAGKYSDALAILADFQLPDDIFSAEYYLLQSLCNLELAAQNSEKAETYLSAAGDTIENTPYCARQLRRSHILLQARQKPEALSALADDELLLRSQAALDRGDHHRCLALLEEAADHSALSWLLLRGDCAAAMGNWSEAILWYRQSDDPATYSKLETCYLQLEDYKMAYHYACKQR